MTLDFVLPKFGMTMTDAYIVRWLVEPGATVRKDEDVVEIETDKVTTMVAAPESGVLTEVFVHAGQEAAVGSVLGTIEVSSAE